MKKTYFAPEFETVELKMNGMLCASVPGAEGGGDDGGQPTTETDPNEDGWDANF